MQEKKRKKKIKLLLFLFWQHAPFSFLSSLLVPHTPKVASAPTPRSFPLGRVSGRQSQGGGDTWEDRDQERHRVVGRGRLGCAGRWTEPS